MKFLPVLFLSLLVTGCSITYSPVEDLGNNIYEITTYGNAFSSTEDLKVALGEKAEEVCGSKNYSFIPNIFGDDISFKTDTTYGAGPGYSDITSGTAIAKISCLPTNQKKSENSDAIATNKSLKQDK
jgi:hypothetical protein